MDDGNRRRLADALGIAEQQLQRYESSDYRSASLARICDIANALDIVVTERAVLRDRTLPDGGDRHPSPPMRRPKDGRQRFR